MPKRSTRTILAGWRCFSVSAIPPSYLSQMGRGSVDLRTGVLDHAPDRLASWLERVRHHVQTLVSVPPEKVASLRLLHCSVVSAQVRTLVSARLGFAVLCASEDVPPLPQADLHSCKRVSPVRGRRRSASLIRVIQDECVMFYQSSGHRQQKSSPIPRAWSSRGGTVVSTTPPSGIGNPALLNPNSEIGTQDDTGLFDTHPQSFTSY